MSMSSTQNLQINTDISPIISPKSNISGSFITPRDNILVNFNANKVHNPTHHEDQHQIQPDNQELHDAYDISNRLNNSDTNESYSIERENGGENTARPEGINYSSNILVIDDNSTERYYHTEDEHSRMPAENMCIIEFEEFVIEQESKKPETEPEKIAPVREENISKEEPVQRKEDTPPKQVPAPKNTKKKGFSFPTIKVDDDIMDPPKIEAKQDKSDLPLQENVFRNSGSDSGRAPKPSIQKFEQPKIEPVKNEPAAEQNEKENKLVEENATLQKQLQELKKALQEKDHTIANLKEDNKNLHEENKKQQNSLQKQLDNLNQQQDALQRQQETIQKQQEAASASKQQETNQKQQDSQLKKENFSLAKKNEDLMKEISSLRQDLSKANQELKETDLENLRLNEKVESQRDFILKLEEKYVNIENINFELDKDIKSKELKLSAVEEKLQQMAEKKEKYKNLSKQKDEQIKELRNQEEKDKNAPNELYISMVEKTKIYKDKISHMTRQIEDQKELIKNKDNAIENLLTRMDELTAALTSKNDEITSIKIELSNLKGEFEVIKNDRRPKTATTTTKSTKSLSTTTNNSQSRERERSLNDQISNSKKSEKSASIGGKTSDSLKKSSDPFQLVEKLKIQANTPKPVFQSYDFNDRLKKSDDDVGGRTWGTMNLKEALRAERDEEYHDMLKKPSKKSLDFDSKMKPSTPQHHKSQGEDSKNTHDIQELQKRLAYLKTKRLEFERKKYGLGGLREDSNDRVKEDNLSLTQTLPNIKSLMGTFTSPMASAKKIDHSSHSDLWHESSKDRESIIQINNFLQENSNNVLFRSSQTNPSVEEAIHSRGSSKNPSKRPPKIDNYQASNPQTLTASTTTNFNKTENFKNSTRYSSANNTSSASKNEYYPSYGHKKSYDSNANSRNELPRNNESPLDRNSQRTRDFKDFLYRGSMTPSAQLQASIMERLMENKTRK